MLSKRKWIDCYVKKTHPRAVGVFEQLKLIKRKKTSKNRMKIIVMNFT